MSEMVRFHQIVFLYDNLLPLSPSLPANAPLSSPYRGVIAPALRPYGQKAHNYYVAILDEDLLDAYPHLRAIRSSPLLLRALFGPDFGLSSSILLPHTSQHVHRYLDDLFKLHSFEFELSRFSLSMFLYFNTPLKNIPKKEVFTFDLEFLPYHPQTPFLNEVIAMQLMNPVSAVTRPTNSALNLGFFFSNFVANFNFTLAVLEAYKLGYFSEDPFNFLLKNSAHFPQFSSFFFQQPLTKHTLVPNNRLACSIERLLQLQPFSEHTPALLNAFYGAFKKNINLVFFETLTFWPFSLHSTTTHTLIAKILQKADQSVNVSTLILLLKRYVFFQMLHTLYFKHNVAKTVPYPAIINPNSSTNLPLDFKHYRSHSINNCLTFLWYMLFIQDFRLFSAYNILNLRRSDFLPARLRFIVFLREKNYNNMFRTNTSYRMYKSTIRAPTHHSFYRNKTHLNKIVGRAYFVYPNPHSIFKVNRLCFSKFSYNNPTLIEIFGFKAYLWDFMSGHKHISRWNEYKQCGKKTSCLVQVNDDDGVYFGQFRDSYLRFLNIAVHKNNVFLTNKNLTPYRGSLNVFDVNSQSRHQTAPKIVNIGLSTSKAPIFFKKWKIFWQKFGVFKDQYFGKHLINWQYYVLSKNFKPLYDIKNYKLPPLTEIERVYQTNKFAFLFSNNTAKTHLSTLHCFDFCDFKNMWNSSLGLKNTLHSLNPVYAPRYAYKYDFFKYVEYLLIDNTYLYIKIAEATKQLGLVSPHPYKHNNNLSFLKQFCNTSRAWTMLWWAYIQGFTDRDLYKFEKIQNEGLQKNPYISRFALQPVNNHQVYSTGWAIFHLEKQYYMVDVVNFKTSEQKQEKVLYKNFFAAISWSMWDLDAYEPISINFRKVLNFTKFFQFLGFHSRGILMGMRHTISTHKDIVNEKNYDNYLKHTLAYARQNEIFFLKKRYLRKKYVEFLSEKDGYSAQRKLLNTINDLFYKNRSRLLIKSTNPSEWKIQDTKPTKKEDITFLSSGSKSDKTKDKRFLILKDETLAKDIILLKKLIKKYNKVREKHKKMFQNEFSTLLQADLHASIEKKKKNTTRTHSLHLEALVELSKEGLTPENLSLCSNENPPQRTNYNC